ncbi:hypothetical protein BC940DRAFT_288306 [Gongronella butleri]|nr:hypothetical protein BC940DRAFT_288306 [Gongronella butleri]
MIFSVKSNKHHVKSFKLNVTTGSHDKPIAFGPGSVVNGQAIIHVSKTQHVRQLKVVFKGTVHAKKCAATIFSVSSVLLDSQIPRARAQGIELGPGNHMYLFAIKLPEANYPPTLEDASYGHQVHYTLQGFLDLENQQLETPPVHIFYLPLVTCEAAAPASPIQRQKLFQQGQDRIQINGIGAPRLTTHNQSEFKISHVDLAMISTTTSQFGQMGLQQHNHTVATDKYHVAHYRRADAHVARLHFKVPSRCVPSSQSHRHIDIAYQLMITVPLYHQSAASNASPRSSLMISLPITVATVPYTSTTPLPQLQIPLPAYQDSHGSRLATDIPSFLDQSTDSGDSPLPSPHSVYSADGSWCDPDRASPTMLDAPALDLPLVPPLALPGGIHTAQQQQQDIPQDESGHLMVPTASTHHPRPRTPAASS